MLKGQSVELRAVELSDVDFLYSIENNVELWSLNNLISPLPKFVLEDYVVNAGQDIYITKQMRFMIDKIGDYKNEAIGCLDLFDFDPHHMRAGIGIIIKEECRNKGYGIEAINLLINYALRILNLHQLYCNILISNLASIKLFKKAGFIEIGAKKDWIYFDNKWIDEIMFQKILI